MNALDRGLKALKPAAVALAPALEALLDGLAREVVVTRAVTVREATRNGWLPLQPSFHRLPGHHQWLRVRLAPVPGADEVNMELTLTRSGRTVAVRLQPTATGFDAIGFERRRRRLRALGPVPKREREAVPDWRAQLDRLLDCPVGDELVGDDWALIISSINGRTATTRLVLPSSTNELIHLTGEHDPETAAGLVRAACALTRQPGREELRWVVRGVHARRRSTRARAAKLLRQETAKQGYPIKVRSPNLLDTIGEVQYLIVDTPLHAAVAELVGEIARDEVSAERAQHELLHILGRPRLPWPIPPAFFRTHALDAASASVVSQQGAHATDRWKLLGNRTICTNFAVLDHAPGPATSRIRLYTLDRHGYLVARPYVTTPEGGLRLEALVRSAGHVEHPPLPFVIALRETLIACASAPGREADEIAALLSARVTPESFPDAYQRQLERLESPDGQDPGPDRRRRAGRAGGHRRTSTTGPRE